MKFLLDAHRPQRYAWHFNTLIDAQYIDVKEGPARFLRARMLAMSQMWVGSIETCRRRQHRAVFVRFAKPKHPSS
jgi:hypothetical protein